MCAVSVDQCAVDGGDHSGQWSVESCWLCPARSRSCRLWHMLVAWGSRNDLTSDLALTSAWVHGPKGSRPSETVIEAKNKGPRVVQGLGTKTLFDIAV